ncbi:hypothetical protein EVAR_83341_1 [Eumeta japonica]|uniref:Uncharacterized protein n=1 Tax=Eumeta variegata TaxID=151549 RepID=A0A4C1VWT4_EUMVA|nr:hypothetical protein EVAR_83341_1 [Eumeta japonica]
MFLTKLANDIPHHGIDEKKKSYFTVEEVSSSSSSSSPLLNLQPVAMTERVKSPYTEGSVLIGACRYVPFSNEHGQTKDPQWSHETEQSGSRETIDWQSFDHSPSPAAAAQGERRNAKAGAARAADVTAGSQFSNDSFAVTSRERVEHLTSLRRRKRGGDVTAPDPTLEPIAYIERKKTHRVSANRTRILKAPHKIIDGAVLEWAIMIKREGIEENMVRESALERERMRER